MRGPILGVLLLGIVAPAWAQTPPILELPPRYSLERVFGTPSTATLDGPVADAHVRAVTAATIAPDGSFYLADGASIRRVLGGVVTTVAGIADRAGMVDGPAAQARFSSWITGLAVTSDGSVLIADGGNHVIRRMTTDGVVSTLAGLPGQSGLAHGRGMAARFTRPRGLTVGAGDIAYVVDETCTVRRLTLTGDVQPIATLPTVSSSCFWTQSALPSLQRTNYDGPVAIAVEPTGTLAVAMADFTVRRVTLAGQVTLVAGVSRQAGPAEGAPGTGRLSTIGGLAVAPSGRLRVLEHFIWFTCLGCGIAQFHGQNAIREIAADGTLSTVATLEPRTGGSGSGFAALVIDSAGTSYVSNYGERRVERIPDGGTVAPWIGGASRNTSTSVLAAQPDAAMMIGGLRELRRLAADGTPGPVLHTTSSNLGPMTRLGTDVYFGSGTSVGRLSAEGVATVVVNLESGLDEALADLAAAPDGTLVARMQRLSSSPSWRLLRVTPQGGVTVIASASGRTHGLAVSPTTGHIFYGDGPTIRRMAPDGSSATVFAGTSDAAPGTVDGVGAAARLVAPTDFTVHADGTVFFVDGVSGGAGYTWWGGVLRQMRPNGEVVSLWSGTATDLGDLELSSTGDLYVVRGGAVYRAVPAAAAPLTITAQPTSTTMQAGANATFNLAATGGPAPLVVWQESRDSGTTWTTLTDPQGGSITGPRLTQYGVTRVMHGYQYRAALADADEFLLSNVVTLSVVGMEISPSTLRFSAVRNSTSGALVHVTPTQAVTISFTTGAPAWTAASSVPWVQIHADTSAGAGRVFVSIVNPGDVIGNQTTLVGAVTITPTDSSLPAITVSVNLSVVPASQSTSAPVGQVDTPTHAATGVQGAIVMTGWVVDDVGIQHVRIYRQCLPFESAPAPSAAIAPCQDVLGQRVVLVGEASVIPGARPDVEASYPTLPAANAAGWGFLILSNLLPNIPASSSSGGGVGTFTLYAVATDIEGHQRLLGRSVTDATPTTLTVANDTIAKPFGTIDTPAQGASVSGTLHNFGWVLTPDPGTGALVPLDGSTVSVFIDGAAVGTATYNLCRGPVAVGGITPSGQLCDDDVSMTFRGDGTRYRNLDAGRGAIALRTISTSALTNGLHTISWGVTDSANRSEGLGSRYFTVLNSSATVRSTGASAPVDSHGLKPVRSEDLPLADLVVYGRTGFNERRAFVPVEPVAGVPSIVVPEMGRVELQVPGATHVALVANGEIREAPVGVSVDVDAGMVRWSVGPGYLGTYRLSVEVRSAECASAEPARRSLGEGGCEVRSALIDVVVAPMALVDEPVRMHLDRTDVNGAAFTVHGWALDPQADTGSGIGAVHVWARPKMSSEAIFGKIASELVYLGTADLGVARPDVAAAHGARFPHAGFSFQGALSEGQWEVTAYIWNTRTGRFEDARSVVITVR